MLIARWAHRHNGGNPNGVFAPRRISKAEIAGPIPISDRRGSYDLWCVRFTVEKYLYGVADMDMKANIRATKGTEDGLHLSTYGPGAAPFSQDSTRPECDGKFSPFPEVEEVAAKAAAARGN
ncbi:MAG TPA: hypothetical protein VF601_21275 [Beijerinckiaceae bacterium]|jgi:hypothetical protein